MDAKVAPARPETDQSFDKLAQEAIEEARVVLPGIQALFGFQLIAVFSERFHHLAQAEQVMHYLALLLVALAVAIIMTPAAYHRLVEREAVTEIFVRLASWLIAGAMVPLMLAVALEVYLLGLIVLHSQATSATIACAVLLVFAGLWFGFPLAARSQRR
jgi:Family of unknown function (DUF6328)